MQVAVVNMTGNSYIGRLFFGDAETGNIVWDCDCRPSDACWLALKVQPLVSHCHLCHFMGSIVMSQLLKGFPYVNLPNEIVRSVKEP